MPHKANLGIKHCRDCGTGIKFGLRCEDCRKTFLEQHPDAGREQRDRLIGNFPCTHEGCLEPPFMTQAGLISHQKRHKRKIASRGGQTFRRKREAVLKGTGVPCDVCGEPQADATGLAIHMGRKHPEVKDMKQTKTKMERILNCPWAKRGCDLKFTEQRNITRHMRESHDPHYVPGQAYDTREENSGMNTSTEFQLTSDPGKPEDDVHFVGYPIYGDPRSRHVCDDSCAHTISLDAPTVGDPLPCLGAGVASAQPRDPLLAQAEPANMPDPVDDEVGADPMESAPAAPADVFPADVRMSNMMEGNVALLVQLIEHPNEWVRVGRIELRAVPTNGGDALDIYARVVE